ncbi:hypothetical protein XFF6992_50043 [Xanthomonas citri pv. fuscans]|nr:hypothetical protein XFF6990_10118 [Xanthomonas citri pv. fuscans]SOO20781.1 hypothetical protein XFF6992_50043 [Xanthomonas citri pv. fuscans]
MSNQANRLFGYRFGDRSPGCNDLVPNLIVRLRGFLSVREAAWSWANLLSRLLWLLNQQCVQTCDGMCTVDPSARFFRIQQDQWKQEMKIA